MELEPDLVLSKCYAYDTSSFFLKETDHRVGLFEKTNVHLHDPRTRSARRAIDLRDCDPDHLSDVLPGYVFHTLSLCRFGMIRHSMKARKLTIFIVLEYFCGTENLSLPYWHSLSINIPTLMAKKTPQQHHNMREGEMPSKLAEIRESRGFSQSELARRVGTTPSTISRLEGGQRKMTVEYLRLLSRALGVSEADLVSESIATLNATKLIPVVGEVSRNAWRVPERAAAQETIPVVPQGEYETLAHAAYLVVDDHADGIAPKGAYAITVPIDGARGGRHIHGDRVVIRSREGRMERHSIARVTTDSRGAFVSLDGEENPITGKDWAVGLVIAIYQRF